MTKKQCDLHRDSLCTDFPSFLRKKAGEGTPLPIVPEGGGDVCTQANTETKLIETKAGTLGSETQTIT